MALMVHFLRGDPADPGRVLQSFGPFVMVTHRGLALVAKEAGDDRPFVLAVLQAGTTWQVEGLSDTFQVCGTFWTLEATCSPHPTDPTKTVWTVGIQGGGLDCACNTNPRNQHEIDFPCFPLEVEGTMGEVVCASNPDPPCDTQCDPGDLPFVLTL